jgi:large subunit ribosomal protein L18
MDKKKSRLKRAAKTRILISMNRAYRLTIHRTPRHIYAQIFTSDGAEVLVSASTLQAEIKNGIQSTGNISAAKAVGTAIGEKAKAVGIVNVAFDRSGFKYHGRVKALADAAREAGLTF